MLQSIGWAAVGTGFTCLMTTLGAAVIFLLPDRERPGFRQAVLGFAAGVMTAASVWSLLLPAIDQARSMHLPGWVPAAAGMVAGAAFLVVFDDLICRRMTMDHDRSTALLMAAITLHNIPEGMAVGLAFALGASGEGMAAAAALALGVGIQNLPEGAAISLPLRQQGKSRLAAFGQGVASGAVEPLFGIAAAACAAAVSGLMPFLLSFAAGAMLYVVVEELVPQAHSRAGTCGFVGGFLVMMILDTALG